MEVDFIAGSLLPQLDVSKAKKLEVNRSPKVCFQGQTPGDTKGFVLTADEAADIVQRDPLSQNVIYLYLIGDELNRTGEPSRFIIDIDAGDAMTARAMAPAAYERIRRMVLPGREKKAREEAEANASLLARNPAARVNRHHQGFYERWWQLAYRRSDLVRAIEGIPRYLALSRVAVVDKPSIYAFVASDVRPGDAVQVFAFADEYSFGLLQSSLHRAWFEERCSTMRHDLRYTSNTVFDTFPWPQAPSDGDVKRIVTAAGELLSFRKERVSWDTSRSTILVSERSRSQSAKRAARASRRSCLCRIPIRQA